jgi:hypothetical protein
MTRASISEIYFAIDESLLIKFNSDYPLDSIEYQLNREIELAHEVEFSMPRVCIVDTQLNSTDIALIFYLVAKVREESHSSIQ